jgi:hypothetical protein
MIFVETDLPHADVYRCAPSGGSLCDEYSGLDAIIPLPEIEAFPTPLAEVYERIEF